jgi:hypothetical protein
MYFNIRANGNLKQGGKSSKDNNMKGRREAKRIKGFPGSGNTH